MEKNMNTPITPTTGIAPKTAAAVGAGGMAIAIVSIANWILTMYHITLPPEVSAAFATLLSGFGAYYAPRSQPAPPGV